MTKKIIKVEDTKKKNTNNGLDLGKIKDVIDSNPDAVKKITEGLGELIISKSTSKKSTKSKTTKKTTKKSSSSDVTNTIKTISSLLGK